MTTYTVIYTLMVGAIILLGAMVAHYRGECNRLTEINIRLTAYAESLKEKLSIEEVKHETTGRSSRHCHPTIE